MPAPNKRSTTQPTQDEGVRLAILDDGPWVASVAKLNAEALGFLPNVQIKGAIEEGHVHVHKATYSFVIFRRRKDGITSVGYLCVPFVHRGKGIGRMLLGSLPRPIILKCPALLPSNEFYRHMGFVFQGFEQSKTRPVNVWRLE